MRVLGHVQAGRAEAGLCMIPTACGGLRGRSRHQVTREVRGPDRRDEIMQTGVAGSVALNPCSRLLASV